MVTARWSLAALEVHQDLSFSSTHRPILPSFPKSIGDLEMQLDFLMKELSGGYRAVLDVLRTATSVTHRPILPSFPTT